MRRMSLKVLFIVGLLLTSALVASSSGSPHQEEEEEDILFMSLDRRGSRSNSLGTGQPAPLLFSTSDSAIRTHQLQQQQPTEKKPTTRRTSAPVVFPSHQPLNGRRPSHPPPPYAVASSIKRAERMIDESLLRLTPDLQSHSSDSLLPSRDQRNQRKICDYLCLRSMYNTICNCLGNDQREPSLTDTETVDSRGRRRSIKRDPPPYMYPPQYPMGSTTVAPLLHTHDPDGKKAAALFEVLEHLKTNYPSEETVFLHLQPGRLIPSNYDPESQGGSPFYHPSSTSNLLLPCRRDIPIAQIGGELKRILRLSTIPLLFLRDGGMLLAEDHTFASHRGKLVNLIYVS